MTSTDLTLKALAMTVVLHMAAPTALAQQNGDRLQPFEADTFQALKDRFEGEPFLVSLWSISCAPCLVELDMLGHLLEEQPDFPLVLISTDPIGQQREEAAYLLEDYGLDHIASWMFADTFAERLRFSIDPGWYGELPRTYLYDGSGSFHVHSGILPREMVDEHFRAEAGAGIPAEGR